MSSTSSSSRKTSRRQHSRLARRQTPASGQPIAPWFGRGDLVACFLVIFGAAILVYIPVMSGGFIWDDEPWITSNPLVRAENRTTWQALAAIWSGSEGVEYYPLTTTLHWLEWRLFGANAAAFHVVNILLHAANSVLVWRVLKSIGVPGAWLAGLIFAVHPVNAATAAWISEGKNTLSLLFYLSSFLVFVRFEQTARARWYVGALLFFAGGLLAKTHGAFIPAVLVLYAWWRHGFSGFASNTATDAGELRALRISNLVLGCTGIAAGAVATFYLWTLSKRFQTNSADPALLASNMFVDGGMRAIFPTLVMVLIGSGCIGLLAAKFAGRINKHLLRTVGFFQLSALLGTTTVWFHGAVAEQIEMGGIARRFANAGSVLWWYIGKTFAPTELAAVYPPWRFDQPTVGDFLPLAGVIVALLALWPFRMTMARHALLAFGTFVLLILPVLGFVTMAYARGGTLVADHLQYLANVPLIAGVAAGVAWLWQRRSRAWRGGIATTVIIALLAMCSYTWARATVYRSEESLWRDTLAKNPDTWQGHNRLGQLLFARRDFAGAADHYQRAAVLKPDLAPNHNNLGLAYARQERFDLAVAAYREAIARSPANAKSTTTFRINLANALGAWGNQVETRSGTLEQARQLYEEAAAGYRVVLAMDDRDAVAHRNLGMVLAQVGRLAEAAEHLRTTLRLIPNEPVATEILEEIRNSR